MEVKLLGDGKLARTLSLLLLTAFWLRLAIPSGAVRAAPLYLHHPTDPPERWVRLNRQSPKESSQLKDGEIRSLERNHAFKAAANGMRNKVWRNWNAILNTLNPFFFPRKTENANRMSEKYLCLVDGFLASLLLLL